MGGIELDEILIVETEINNVMSAMKLNSRWSQRSKIVSVKRKEIFTTHYPNSIFAFFFAVASLKHHFQYKISEFEFFWRSYARKQSNEGAEEFEEDCERVSIAKGGVECWRSKPSSSSSEHKQQWNN